jgi:predicted PhzF superfamily epimerase YddE/YHI9
LTGPRRGHDHLGVWAWIDERAGTVRARVFPVRYGIAEDEATGSAAVLLSAQLDRALEIRQGRGSLIRVRPVEDGSVEVGGVCVLDEVRDYS